MVCLNLSFLPRTLLLIMKPIIFFQVPWLADNNFDISCSVFEGKRWTACSHFQYHHRHLHHGPLTCAFGVPRRRRPFTLFLPIAVPRQPQDVVDGVPGTRTARTGDHPQRLHVQPETSQHARGVLAALVRIHRASTVN